MGVDRNHEFHPLSTADSTAAFLEIFDAAAPSEDERGTSGWREVGSMGGWVDGHHDLPCDLLGLIVHGMG